MDEKGLPQHNSAGNRNDRLLLDLFHLDSTSASEGLGQKTA